MIRKRLFLVRTTVVVFLVWLPVCAVVGTERANVRITHGPILGRLGADGVGVWVRTSQPGAFVVRYGLSPDRLEKLSEKAETKLSNDNTGRAWIKGLESDTQYYYHVETLTGETSDVLRGSFRTLPAGEDYHNEQYNPRGLFNFSFEFACGNSPQPSEPPRPTYVTMLRLARDRINFAILNGDWLYESSRDFTVAQWLDQVGLLQSDTPKIVTLTPSVVGVWENYKEYLENDRNLAAWHRHVPSFFTFDDHEILGDINGAGEKGFVNKKAVFRDIGVKAWYDYLGWSNPPSFDQDILFGTAELKQDSDILVDQHAAFTKLDLEQTANLHIHWGGQLAGTRNMSEGDKDLNTGVYEIVEVIDDHSLRISPAARATKSSAYSIGRLSHSEMQVSNCHFFFLDTRSHRQLHDARNPEKPGVSLIGRKQKAWLTSRMRASDADFLFVVSSINFMIPHVAPNAGRNSNKSEAWTAFLHEREQLIDFWDSLGKPVLVLTGDLHNSFAIKITDRVWEFASGPHSSGNHGARSEGNRPPNGTFKNGPRTSEIRWSSYVLDQMTRRTRLPHYCVVQINNVFRNTDSSGRNVSIAFPRPHLLFQYYDGLTGELRYAEPIFASENSP